MITTVTLSRGALRMASRKVIVKRLASIHDLGAMTMLCTDKTGTLTSAEITLARSLNSAGVEDPPPPGSARSRPIWVATEAHWTLRWWPERSAPRKVGGS
jgi:magnesium-transporting ATPase (P-type)